jgi:hypothetical protein
MKMKHFRGQLIRLKFRDMKPIDGIVIDYNDDWMLLKSNPNDYIIDGYAIVKNHGIKDIVLGDEEKWREKVIKLKKYKTLKAKIPLRSLEDILKTLTKRFGVFTLYTKEDGICWLGRLKSIDHKSVVIDDMTPKGKWVGTMTFKTKDIRVIEFETDYINSLKLVSKKTRRKKGNR